MRVLVVHNAYQQRGGEDGVVENEVALLRSGSHEVSVQIVNNHSIAGAAAKVRTFINTPYSPSRFDWMQDEIARIKPDIVHIHNFFPLLTPAIHNAAAEAGAVVVQTLHNYRTVCAGAFLLREGKVCEKCLTGARFWGAIHRCYRGSLPGSVAVVGMQMRADRGQFWKRSVHRFIALTEFAKEKFGTGGLPKERISVKPNFIASSDMSSEQRDGFLFIGRLSPEKGAHLLILAAKQLPHTQITVIGDGPEENNLRQMAPPNVHFTGPLVRQEVDNYLRKARALIVPSLWYEGFPMVLLEAFAQGVPVIASNIGSLGELIQPGSNGELFEPGDVDGLVAKLQALDKSPKQLTALGVGARRCYDELYTPQRNLALLEAIYRQAIETAETDRN